VLRRVVGGVCFGRQTMRRNDDPQKDDSIDREAEAETNDQPTDSLKDFFSRLGLDTLAVGIGRKDETAERDGEAAVSAVDAGLYCNQFVTENNTTTTNCNCLVTVGKYCRYTVTIWLQQRVGRWSL
jgi:hypothetical protein